jgi:hypothetical protein
MEMTTEEQKIFDGLSDFYQNVILENNSIVMKGFIDASDTIRIIPIWILEKIDYLRSCGFKVDVKHEGDFVFAECDITAATFAQRLKIWNLDGFDEKNRVGI